MICPATQHKTSYVTLDRRSTPLEILILSQIISVLLSGGPDAQTELKKGALCKVSTDDLIYGQCATLHWLLAPAQLRKLR